MKRQSWAVRQYKGKNGPGGLRFIPMCDSMAKAWTRASTASASTDDTDFADGHIPHKCRENALIVQMAMAWRLRDLQVHPALGLYVASHAFCCIAHSDLDEATQMLVRQLEMHGAQHRQQVLTVGVADGEVTMLAG